MLVQLSRQSTCLLSRESRVRVPPRAKGLAIPQCFVNKHVKRVGYEPFAINVLFFHLLQLLIVVWFRNLRPLTLVVVKSCGKCNRWGLQKIMLVQLSWQSASLVMKMSRVRILSPAYVRVAQSVEQQPFKLLVGSSSLPTDTTRKPKEITNKCIGSFVKIKCKMCSQLTESRIKKYKDL